MNAELLTFDWQGRCSVHLRGNQAGRSGAILIKYEDVQVANAVDIQRGRKTAIRSLASSRDIIFKGQTVNYSDQI